MTNYYSTRISGAVPARGDTVLIEFREDFSFSLKEEYRKYLDHKFQMTGVISNTEEESFVYTVNEVTFSLNDIESIRIVNENYS